MDSFLKYNVWISLKIFVIPFLLLHIFFWMEERGAETNGHGDPIGNPKI